MTIDPHFLWLEFEEAVNEPWNRFTAPCAQCRSPKGYHHVVNRKNAVVTERWAVCSAVCGVKFIGRFREVTPSA